MHVQGFQETNVIRRYMEALALHTSALTVHWEDKTSCISVVGDDRVNPRVKQIYIPVCLLLEQFNNGLFTPKYEKSSFMPADRCTKPCSGPIISRVTKGMNGFRLYPTSDTESYQIMRLHEFFVN